jgi:hypothetical protein
VIGGQQINMSLDRRREVSLDETLSVCAISPWI